MTAQDKKALEFGHQLRQHGVKGDDLDAIASAYAAAQFSGTSQRSDDARFTAKYNIRCGYRGGEHEYY